MIGYVNEYGQPRVELKVSGLACEMEISFVIDTGFDGSLCLPVEVAVQLGLRLKGIQEVEYADGSIKRELVFLGKVFFDDRDVDIDIFLTDSKDALLGTQLLSKKVLTIDFRRKFLEISWKYYPSEGFA